MAARKSRMNKSVDWGYYDISRDLDDRYLPSQGEGDTMATQIATAVNKLIYKWYNDGDVFDNNYALEGWANDLSSFANWLYANTSVGPILDRIKTIGTEGEYEDMLREIHDAIYTEEYLAEMDKRPAVGSVYDCDGPFYFYDGGYCERCGERLYDQGWDGLCEECYEEVSEEEEAEGYDASLHKSFNDMVREQRIKNNKGIKE